MFRSLHRSVLLGVTTIALVLLIGFLAVPQRPDAHSKQEPVPSTRIVRVTDKWGIEEIRETRSGGTEWYADWDDRGVDHWIQWIDTGGTHTVHPEDAVLEVGGNAVRMYVLNPRARRQREQWTGALEVTVYARRIAGGGGEPYSGIVTSVRTNHGSVGDLQVDPCDSRGLYARLRFDGKADFGKETKHPYTVSHSEKRIWTNGMPKGVWIGYKHIVYDTEAGVVQELWVDYPGDGQHWRRVNRIVDRGTSWGQGARPCRDGIDPAMELRGGSNRRGSESELPNVAVLFRVDNLSPDGGLEYKEASVREVE